jgi:uncharacterized repeat protein (TIGR03803 family)
LHKRILPRRTPHSTAFKKYRMEKCREAESSRAACPHAGLTLAPDGSLYGATYHGGNGRGVVFELAPPAPAGGAWAETVLHTFLGHTDGANPQVTLALTPDGTIFGTTAGGGANMGGTVFRLLPPAASGAGWMHSVLFNFAGGTYSGPRGALALARNGRLYGTNLAGGLGMSAWFSRWRLRQPPAAPGPRPSSTVSKARRMDAIPGPAS